MEKDKYEVWREKNFVHDHIFKVIIKKLREDLQFYADMKAEVQWLEDRGRRARAAVEFLEKSVVME